MKNSSRMLAEIDRSAAHQMDAAVDRLIQNAAVDMQPGPIPVDVTLWTGDDLRRLPESVDFYSDSMTCAYPSPNTQYRASRALNGTMPRRHDNS